MRRRTAWAAAGLGLALWGCKVRTVPYGAEPEPSAEAPAHAPTWAASIVKKKGRAVTLPIHQAEWIHAGQHVDLVALLGFDGEPMAMTLLQNVVVLGAEPLAADARDGTREVTLLLLPEETEQMLLAQQSGRLFASLRNTEDLDFLEERGRATSATLMSAERRDRLLKKRHLSWK